MNEIAIQVCTHSRSELWVLKAVSARTSLATRSGREAANCCATIPPRECPHTWARSTFKKSSKRAATGSSRIVYTIIVRGMAPGRALWVWQRTLRGMRQGRFSRLTLPLFNGIRTIVDIAHQAAQFSVLGSWFLVPGSRFLVLSSQFLVLGSRFSVLSSRFPVLGSQFLVLGSRFLVLSSQFSVPGSQFSVLSSRFPTTAIAAPSTLPVFGRAHRVLPGCSRYAS